MPHGKTWFHILFESAYNALLQMASVLGFPFNEEGRTWIAGEPIDAVYVMASALVVFLLIALGLISYTRTRRPNQALLPDTRLSPSTLIEILVGTTLRMMSDVMGRKAAEFFLPLIGTCALFILFANLLGLVPGFLPPTGTLNLTLACALVVMVSTQVFGIKEHGFAYIAHFFGPVRKWYALPLMLMMLGIELFSHLLVRPGSLSVRLMANMTADHMVLETFHTLHPVVAFGVPVLVYMLGTLVCIVQTLVFCLLSTAYIAMAVDSGDH